MATLTINGLDLDTVNVKVRRAPGILSSPPYLYDKIERFGYPGAVIQNVRTGTKPFSFGLWVEGADYAEAQDNWDAVRSTALLAQPAEIILGGDETRKISAMLTGADLSPEEFEIPFLVVPTWPASLAFEAVQNPYWQAVTETTVGSIGSTPVELPMGTAPTWLQVKIAGPATDPTLTLTSSTGATAATVGFTLSVASGHFLCVDFKMKTAYDNTDGSFNSGTRRLGSGTYSVGSITNGWQMDRSIWVYRTSSWPKLSCSSGTATAIYRRQYD